MKLWVFSLDMVESIEVFSKKVFVISITSPINVGGRPAKIEGKNIHRFEFQDIQEELLLEDRHMIIRPMEKEIGDMIVDAVIQNKEKPVWVIHCEAGISRSPAVALALCRFFTFENTDVYDLEKRFPCFNKHVRKMVEGAMLRRLKAEDQAIDLGG